MSLERKDIRAKLDPDMHHALSVLADVDQLDMGEWVERVLLREITRRVHEATVIADRIPRSGKSGSSRE
jgi:hypothetical protein